MMHLDKEEAHRGKTLGPFQYNKKENLKCLKVPCDKKLGGSILTWFLVLKVHIHVCS